MSKIIAMIPHFCSIKHTLEKPDNWDKMTLKQKKEYFFSNSESSEGLCYQCSNDVELDGSSDDKTYFDETFWDERDFQEDIDG